MNRRQTLIAIFAAVAALQLAAPFSMISKRELTLREGTLFKFRTAPVDPYDAFRGRYVALQLEAAHCTATNAASFQNGQAVYALLENDADGFARVLQVVADHPAKGEFIKTRVQYVNGSTLALQWPFDRFYLPEALAPEAEKAYRIHSSRGNRTAYVAVRVRSGFAAIENLYVDGLPILEFVHRNAQPPR